MSGMAGLKASSVYDGKDFIRKIGLTIFDSSGIIKKDSLVI